MDPGSRCDRGSVNVTDCKGASWGVEYRLQDAQVVHTLLDNVEVEMTGASIAGSTGVKRIDAHGITVSADGCFGLEPAAEGDSGLYIIQDPVIRFEALHGKGIGIAASCGASVIVSGGTIIAPTAMTAINTANVSFAPDYAEFTTGLIDYEGSNGCDVRNVRAVRQSNSGGGNGIAATVRLSDTSGSAALTIANAQIASMLTGAVNLEGFGKGAIEGVTIIDDGLVKVVPSIRLAPTSGNTQSILRDVRADNSGAPALAGFDPSYLPASSAPSTPDWEQTYVESHENYLNGRVANAIQLCPAGLSRP